MKRLFFNLSFVAFLVAALSVGAQTPGLSTDENGTNAKLSPSLQPVVDVPGLPRVLLIGDSVSMGYTVRVREALKGKANVHRAPTNCGPTTKGVAEIDRWLGTSHWDVVHFNFGLHDIRYVKTNVINVPPEQYEANLRQLVERMKRTKAKLIWATTTPAPPKPRPGQFLRVPADVVTYNQIAARIMRTNAVAIDDLYAAVLPRIAELQPPGDVHFNSQGCDVLAAQVARSIAAVLPEAKISPVEADPRIASVEPRVWSCDFTSAALEKPMRFLVVLPEGVTLSNARLPVIYFLHGRGRHERTLLDNDTRQRVLASPCAVVLPRGQDGWYVNSPVIAKDRYADYLDEVIKLAEQHFPVANTAKGRAIGGWSMGGYGTVYTACRRPGDFAAVASIIGILDYPRPDVPIPGQNYAVQPRFGTNVAGWDKLNPRKLMAGLDGVPLFVAYADKAAERQMNEAFLADARARGLKVEVLPLSGGHTFPIVEQALGPAFSFMESSLAKSKAAR